MAGGSLPTLLSDESDHVVASGLLIFGDEKVRVSCGFLMRQNEAQLRDEMKRVRTTFRVYFNKNLVFIYLKFIYIGSWFQIKSDLISPACASFGVILKCKTRRQEMFGRAGVESTCLQESLPQTKLVGTVVDGRFGRMEGGTLITQTENMSLTFICSYLV